MQKEWLSWLIDKFVTEETLIRCCGSCMGGCESPSICFLCVGYNQKHLNEYITRVGMENLQKEFEEWQLNTLL